MGRRLIRGAAATVLFAAAVLAGGCGSDSSDFVLLAGSWSGSLNLSYEGGGGASGALRLRLDQLEEFVSGTADWQPAGSEQSVTGPVDGNTFTLLLHFRCGLEAETTRLTGTLDGETLTVTGASGMACSNGGGANAVSGATGSLTRTTDGAPL